MFTESKHHHNRLVAQVLPSVMSVCAVLILFSDARVLFRVLVPIPGVSEALGVMVAGVFITLSILIR